MKRGKGASDAAGRAATPACVFCERLAAGEVLAANELAVALVDRFPVSAGHTLIVPRRHEPDFFRLTLAEQTALLQLVVVVRDLIERQQQPAGYNIGINVGGPAGQTVSHAHVHVIPRYLGDVADPRGGVRWVLPDRAAYWER